MVTAESCSGRRDLKTTVDDGDYDEMLTNEALEESNLSQVESRSNDFQLVSKEEQCMRTAPYSSFEDDENNCLDESKEDGSDQQQI